MSFLASKTKPPADPLRCHLAELDGFWLELRCEKSHISNYPLRLLGMEQGRNAMLGALLPRFRCQWCKGKPASAVLSETPYDTTSGMGGCDVVGWRIDLSAHL